MSNYDGIDRLSPGDEDLLAHDARRLQRRRDGHPTNDPPNCWGCPNGCNSDRCGIRLCVRGCDDEATEGGLCVKCAGERFGEVA